MARCQMTHAIHWVERFEIVGPYTLALRFDDGTEQRIDFPGLKATLQLFDARLECRHGTKESFTLLGRVMVPAEPATRLMA
jgi:hypothetical protein